MGFGPGTLPYGEIKEPVACTGLIALLGNIVLCFMLSEYFFVLLSIGIQGPWASSQLSVSQILWGKAWVLVLHTMWDVCRTVTHSGCGMGLLAVRDACIRLDRVHTFLLLLSVNAVPLEPSVQNVCSP